MNGNSSKQVLLSVLGIAVLVVAVVGVSFAFFTYSKNGLNPATIQTGSIFAQFTEGRAILLTNQFPIPDSKGADIVTNHLTGSDANEQPTLTFYVKAKNTSSKEMTYTISATTGDIQKMTVPNPAHESDPSQPETKEVDRPRLHDSGIKLYLDATGARNGTITRNNYSSTTGTAVGTDGSLANGRELLVGTIPGGTTSEVTNTFVLHMWISDSVVQIDEVHGADDDTDNLYTSADFAELYYSLRVDVTANATNS